MPMPPAELLAPSVLPDLVGVAHLLSVSVATGLVGFLNISLLKRWFIPMHAEWVSFHLRAQEFVIGTAIFAWITGNMLVWLIYRLDSALFPEALWVKLVMVKLLFVSALYSRLHLPKTLRANAGLKITELPTALRLRVALAAGLSLTSWLGTFLISASQTVQRAPATLAMEVVLVTAFLCLGAMSLLALLWKKPLSKQALRALKQHSQRHFGPVDPA